MPPKKRPSADADTSASKPAAKRGRKQIAETAATARPKRLPKLPPRAAKVNATVKPASAAPAAAPDTPKKRGRPAKSAPSVKDEKLKTKPKAAAAAKTATGKPKKRRGRPPKASIEATKTATRKRKRSTGKTKKPVEQTSKRTRRVVDQSFAHLNEKEPDLTIEVPEDDAYGPEGQSFWLMKAEPESRLVKGVDVKFSIDDLRDATEPEPWDGVRNPVARNNLRAMKKGDYAFFYHSSCKVPGIVGLMEIVKEHSVDESAFDPAHPYYDEKSTRENPKWEVVHVEFRRKFDNILTLEELKSHATAGKPLENLQTLRQSRVSVSRVTPREWEFIMRLIEKANKPAKNVVVEAESSAEAAPAPESSTENKTADEATKPENQEPQQGAHSETNNVDVQESNNTGTTNGHTLSEQPSAAAVDGADKPKESEANHSMFSLF